MAFRWLVADDVGLGKTIECGLVLMPLIASARVRRLILFARRKACSAVAISSQRYV